MRRAGAFILVSAIGFITLNSMPAQDDKPKSAADSVPSSFRSYVVVDDRFPPKMAPVKRAFLAALELISELPTPPTIAAPATQNVMTTP